MKAFDTSKHLGRLNFESNKIQIFDLFFCKENALYCCGYSKPSGVKFEQFLINLIENDLENSLPKKLFKDFILYYKWILHDPKVSCSSIYKFFLVNYFYVLKFRFFALMISEP